MAGRLSIALRSVSSSAFSPRKDNLTAIIILGALVLVLLPTSWDGQIFEPWRLVVLWGLSGVLVLSMALLGGVEHRAAIFSLTTFVYLVAVTILAITHFFPDARLSLARLIPILVVLGMFALKFPNLTSGQRVIIRGFDALMIALTAINLGIILRIPFVHDFVISLYSQYYPEAIVNAMYYAKPVFVFGVHSYASWAYMLLFVLSFYSWRTLRSKRYLIYGSLLLLFTLALRSQSALVFAAFMIGLAAFETFRELRPHWKRLGSRARSLAIFAVFLTLGSMGSFVILNYGPSLASATNGVFVRYGAGLDYFEANLEVITSSPGIGFTIVDSMPIVYSDSGPIMYATMGHIPFVLAFYGLLAWMAWRNVAQGARIAVIATLLLFEFALPATFNVRFPGMFVFVIGYLSAIHSFSPSLRQDAADVLIHRSGQEVVARSDDKPVRHSRR